MCVCALRTLPSGRDQADAAPTLGRVLFLADGRCAVDAAAAAAASAADLPARAEWAPSETSVDAMARPDWPGGVWASEPLGSRISNDSTAAFWSAHGSSAIGLGRNCAAAPNIHKKNKHRLQSPPSGVVTPTLITPTTRKQRQIDDGFFEKKSNKKTTQRR